MNFNSGEGEKFLVRIVLHLDFKTLEFTFFFFFLSESFVPRLLKEQGQKKKRKKKKGL